MSSVLVVVGGGPAGLAAAATIRRAAPGLELLVLEAGSGLEERQRGVATDVAAGVGGAGLFSDGKFSFPPSGSGLQELGEGLEVAWDDVRAWLTEAGLAVPPLEPTPVAPAFAEGSFKPYPSIYLDLAARRALIARLMAPLGDAVRTGARVTSVEPVGASVRVAWRSEGQRREVEASAVIVAGGRFGPSLLAEVAPMRFRRVEVGVRLEGPSGHGFFGELVREGRSLDPKWIAGDLTATSWRTFCCCVDGELVEAALDGRRLWSGRADVPASGRSNVGFNVRFGSAATAPGIEAIGRAACGPPPTLSEALDRPALLAPALGDVAAEAVVEGLRLLVKRIPAALAEAPEPLRVWAPCLEGIGRYPETDASLRVGSLPLYVAGDATGRFRGIVAAMVSGVFAGRRAVEGLGRG